MTRKEKISITETKKLIALTEQLQAIRNQDNPTPEEQGVIAETFLLLRQMKTFYFGLSEEEERQVRIEKEIEEKRISDEHLNEVIEFIRQRYPTIIGVGVAVALLGLRDASIISQEWLDKSMANIDNYRAYCLLLGGIIFFKEEMPDMMKRLACQWSLALEEAKEKLADQAMEAFHNPVGYVAGKVSSFTDSIAQGFWNQVKEKKQLALDMRDRFFRDVEISTDCLRDYSFTSPEAMKVEKLLACLRDLNLTPPLVAESAEDAAGPAPSA